MAGAFSALILIRPTNCLLAGVAVWVGAYMTLAPAPMLPVTLTAICAFLVCAAGNVFNDIIDIEADKIAHPDRILATGKLPVLFARRLAVVANLAAVAIALAVGIPVLLVVVASILLLYLYNWRLKRIPFLGNMLVATVAAGTFIAGGLASSIRGAFDLPGPLIPAAFAFFLHLMRELTKDIQDIEGDRAVGIRTLPAIIGARWTLAIVTGLGVVLSWLSVRPYLLEWYGLSYLWITVVGVLVPAVGLSVVALVRPRPGFVRLLASGLKVSMVIGLVALLSA